MTDRRSVLKLGLAAAAGPLLGPAAAGAQEGSAGDPWRGLKIGVASYTFRSFPVDATIKGIKRVGLKYVSIKDSHLPMKSTPEERKAVGQQFRDAGITPLSCGVVYLPKDEPGIRAAFEYARDLGVPTMVCSFEPVILPLLDPLVKEFNIRLAIHNHGPGDKNFPTPGDIMKAVSSHDERIGVCIDIGHTLRAGVDPAAAIRACRSRLYDMHLKDVTMAAAKGGPVEGGRGVLDLKSVFKALLDIRYPNMAGFEYEKDGADPLPGLAETVGYCRGLLASL